MPRPWIAHVDMDAFFASVEQRDRPELRGRPVVVGGDGRRGVVAAASYEARDFGVHSAMPAGRARRLCPSAVFVTPRHARYREMSAHVFAIFAAFSGRVEGLSLDEAFLELSESGDDAVVARARALKRRISVETGLTASVGIAANKLVAKLASAYDKPDGLTWIRPDETRRFLDPLPVRKLPGVGPATAARLHDAGILTIGQLRRANPVDLESVLATQAGHFARLAAGLDDRPVRNDRPRRSISQESTFNDDLSDPAAIARVIGEQAGRCAERLAERSLYARTVHLKLRSRGFSTLTRSRTLAGFTRSPAIITATARELADEWARYQSHIGLRLIGVGVSGLAASPDPEDLLA